ncbi:MAG: lytic murein transglycosylase [Novosphingobium sp.]|nr:lytic murein transglycosylase [Novosphingobium sp.]
MSLRSQLLALTAVFGLCTLSADAAAQEVVQPLPPAAAADAGFDSYVAQLAAQARAQGVSAATVSAMTAGLTPNSRVIALDRSQPAGPPGSGFPPLAPYLSQHIDANRIGGGKRVLAGSADLAQRIEAQYGVPAQILIAIWGHETNYGSVKGDFDLARSLASLAWEGRRRELFAQEFIDVLKIADSGVPRSTLVGSYAGAFGNPQFLPSVYLRLAVDGDGDGRKDIWNNRTDTLYSIANYFRDAGWRAGQPWGVGAAVPAGFDVGAYKGEIASPVCPRVHERFSQWKTVNEWKQLGVQPLAPIGDSVMASLFQPDGPGTRAWLLTGNYRVILEYNCSNYYAMSVGLLADEIVK